MLIEFYLRFSTKYGQSLLVKININESGRGYEEKIVPLQYFNNEYWLGAVEVDLSTITDTISYQYLLREENGEEIMEWGSDRMIHVNDITSGNITFIDTWNHAGEIENAFFSKPFQEILLPKSVATKKKSFPKKYTHEFRVKAPLLKTDEVVCICGPSDSKAKWNPDNTHTLQLDGNWFVTRLDLSEEHSPLTYRYAIYNTQDKKIVQYENGASRILMAGAHPNRITILHDGFVYLSNNTWKAAGVAIPVFSLKSKSSFGTGEFTDIKLLADWAKTTGLKMIQLLPLNDTTATHTLEDSYPYAAISAFALHPMYLNLDTVAGKENADIVKPLLKKQKQLNEAAELDYEQVMKFKTSTIKELYLAQKEIFKDDTKYFLFFEMNRHWLVPYAAFCYLRDKYATADFSQWKTNSKYDENAIQRLASPSQAHYDDIAIHYFTQYHLHLQLKDATSYAHKNGIIVKGDIPIGVSRFSCDAWTEPELYHMEEQAGAPPDDFAVKGQNWGFPTYNCKKNAGRRIFLVA